MRAKITGTGSYLPERVMTNRDLETLVDTSDEWITERTGIKERRIAAPNEAASDLACEASQKALSAAGLKPKHIDLIIAATVTGDMPFPSTACTLQALLGAKNAAAFDLNAACSGFLYGLSVAECFIKAGSKKRILVVGSEVLSKFVDWEDRGTCVLFGDGAGAAVVEATEGESGIISTEMHSDGTLGGLLCIPGGGSRIPPSKDSVRDGSHFIKMKGNETFKIAVRTLERLVVDTLKKNKIKPSELALLIPHQANLRIIQAAAERLRLPMEKVLVNIDRYGNTSAASVPIALDEAVRSGRVREGDYILLEAFGGGLTWAAVLLKW
ncbi:MAG: beta-ketoacyl-ACP synthase III [Thermodesulfovibrionales bacterium]|nr:beta-ketoacyl-ACP synthase III [Thermodesulfovibrionales bacterium]